MALTLFLFCYTLGPVLCAVYLLKRTMQRIKQPDPTEGYSFLGLGWSFMFGVSAVATMFYSLTCDVLPAPIYPVSIVASVAIFLAGSISMTALFFKERALTDRKTGR